MMSYGVFCCLLLAQGSGLRCREPSSGLCLSWTLIPTNTRRTFYLIRKWKWLFSWVGVFSWRCRCLWSLPRSLPLSRTGPPPSKSTLISPAHPARSSQLHQKTHSSCVCYVVSSLQRAHLSHLLMHSRPQILYTESSLGNVVYVKANTPQC